MAKKKPSPRQQEIINLIKKQPGITANQIANDLHTSPGAVYQQISRLRSAGLLPKTSKAPSPKLRSGAAAEVPPTTAVATNGHRSIEQHLTDELAGVILRIEEIGEQRDRLKRESEEKITALGGEEETLTLRRKRLEKANTALTAA